MAETPCWASAQPGKVCNPSEDSKSNFNVWYHPTNNSDSADALTYLINRYAGKVYAWEVWNEPNISTFWPSGPSASQYSAMLKAAYNAIKAASPTSTILGGSLSAGLSLEMNFTYQTISKLIRFD